MTTPFSSAASITISWSTRKIASATRPYWAHCRRSSTGTSTSPWIKNASLGPTSSRPDPAYASASPPCPAPCTSPSTTCTATIPSQVIPMGPPSTISEPDSGMHSLTDSVCGCGVGQPVSPANLELLHFLWGRLSTCRRLSAGAHVGQASPPAAGLQTRNVGQASTPAAGLQTRNVGQASTPAAGLRTRNVGQAVSPAKHNHQPPAGVPSGSHQPRRAMLAFALALLLAPLAHAASIPSFSILSDDQGGWPLLLQSVGFMPQPAASARIFVLRAGSAGSPEWPARNPPPLRVSSCCAPVPPGPPNGPRASRPARTSSSRANPPPPNRSASAPPRKTCASPAWKTCICPSCPSCGRRASNCPATKCPPRPTCS